MIMSVLTNEYYRALARIILDIRFRRRIAKLTADERIEMLKDAGFDLGDDDIARIKTLPDISTKISDPLIQEFENATRPPTQVKPVDVFL
jgi:hypothetical protein